MSEKLFAGLTYEQAIRKFSKTVTGVCIMRLQNYADVEDCFQNTFVKLYTSSKIFADEDHLKAWLIRIAINECTDLLRKSRWFAPFEDARKAKADFPEDSIDISWALLKTPQKYRDVLYLYYCEQYKVSEIAEILGINEAAVKGRLRRGREKLKDIYGGD